MLDGTQTKTKPLTIEEAVYGNFANFVPRHHVFEGFESNDEFKSYLTTLLEWQVEERDGLNNLGVNLSEDISELENSMAHLIQSANQVKDMQTGL